jgi:integrase
MSELLLDRAGRRRSPATMPGFHAGRPPHNKGLRYPADPPNVEEIVAVMGAAGDDAHARRLRGLIVILWRAGLRIQEALALSEADLDQRRGALLVRRGKGGRRREVGMDAWGWEQLQPWLELRLQLPVGPLLCVINGPTRGRHWSSAAARADLRRTAVHAGVRRRFAPHQLRHAHAVELTREGVPLIVIQRQLGHSNLGITSVYLQGIDNAEIIETVHARHQPMIQSQPSHRADKSLARRCRSSRIAIANPEAAEALPTRPKRKRFRPANHPGRVRRDAPRRGRLLMCPTRRSHHAEAV